jgi:hypothetical protein
MNPYYALLVAWLPLLILTGRGRRQRRDRKEPE